MNGNQAIAHILKAEGVAWLSAFPAQPLIDEAARAGIPAHYLPPGADGRQHGRRL